ncbi:MAG: FkbM family methyltransferase [Candidatus Micrarchaeota archaeon]|nr:FkbM family methyltransferase [Candidatus Micrarchaeota archaeon]
MISNVSARDRILLYLIALPAAANYIGVVLRTYLFPIIANVSNWWAPALVYAMGGTSSVRFKDGTSFALSRSNMSEFIARVETMNPPRMPEGFSMSKHGGAILIKARDKRILSDKESATAIVAEFYSGDHSLIDVKGRDVVDIGAYVGDSALYYLIGAGARNVYAFEPVASLAKLAERNGRLNKLGKRLTVYNAAVSGSASASRGATISDGFSGKGDRASTIRLSDVVRRHGLSGAALKVDCEGCEYGIFRSLPGEVLSKFDVVHVEYHYGYRDIEERLRAEGYEVRHTMPKVGFSNMFRKTLVTGDIVAVRRKSAKRH